MVYFVQKCKEKIFTFWTPQGVFFHTSRGGEGGSDQSVKKLTLFFLYFAAFPKKQ